MIIPSFEEIREITDSRYALVMLVAKRSRLILEGNPPFVDTDDVKPVTVAMEEILDRQVVFGESLTDREYEEKINRQKEEKLQILREEIGFDDEFIEE